LLSLIKQMLCMVFSFLQSHKSPALQNLTTTTTTTAYLFSAPHQRDGRALPDVCRALRPHSV
jgi:hypothetical protein